ncbi:MAG TPA: anaerobic ribonucleoside-triphosphate reductase activating protein [Clostridiales bacterium]|nr:anaerobic ribonucleoside-triphosphate reductase activating protein [Clostridiales bacterium]
MKIHGFNKLTLLDYPGHMAATVFLGGCNMRCPFCHNASLVTRAASQPTLPAEEVLNTLFRRRHLLEGICITGGEPTLNPGLTDFIRQLKSYDFKVKLDTNGTNPALLKVLVQDGLIDYIAMDIKNSKAKYAPTSGIAGLELDKIEESVDFLLSGLLDYELRTTIVKELHTREDMRSIGEWIAGAKAYYLQSYQASGDIIEPGFNPYPKEELEAFTAILKPYVNRISLRGVD